MSGFKFGKSLYLTLKTRVVSCNYAADLPCLGYFGRVAAHWLPFLTDLLVGSKNLWARSCQKTAARGTVWSEGAPCSASATASLLFNELI